MNKCQQIVSTTAGLVTYRALVRFRVRTNLFKHFVEVSEYPGVPVDQFLELENDRGELVLVNATCSRTDTVLDELSEQFALELPNDVGVLGEPSGNGTTVFDLNRHVDVTVVVNGYTEIAIIREDHSQLNEKTNDEEMKGHCWDFLYCSVERVCHGLW